MTVQKDKNTPSFKPSHPHAFPCRIRSNAVLIDSMAMVEVRNSSTFRSPLKYWSTSSGTLSRLFQPIGKGRGGALAVCRSG